MIMETKIDRQRIITSDEIENTQDYIKGAVAILNSLQSSTGTCVHKYDSQAFIVLQNALDQVIFDQDEIKEQVEYTRDIITELINEINNLRRFNADR